MIAWLFWPSLAALIFFGWVWLVVTFAPRLGVALACFGSLVRAMKLGDMAPRAPEYPEDGC